MDRKTLVAVALCVLSLIFYRRLLHMAGLDKYMPQPQTTAPRDSSRAIAEAPPPAVTTTAPTACTLSGPAGVATPPQTRPNTAAAGTLFATPSPVPKLAAAPRTYELETPFYVATFSSRGARLLGVELKHFASANGPGSHNGRAVRPRAGEDVPPGDRVALSGGPLLAMDLGSGDDRRDLSGVEYAVQESLDASGHRVSLTFTATDSSGATVRQTYRSRPDEYAIDLDVTLRGVPVAWRLADYSLTVRSWPLLTEADELADARSLRATSLVGTNLHRDHAQALVKKPHVYEGSAAWAAVQSRYFVAAVAPQHGSGRAVVSSAVKRPMLPAELAALPPGAHAEGDVTDNTLAVGLPSELEPARRFVVYVGPCEFFRLASLKLQLER